MTEPKPKSGLGKFRLVGHRILPHRILQVILQNSSHLESKATYASVLRV